MLRRWCILAILGALLSMALVMPGTATADLSKCEARSTRSALTGELMYNACEYPEMDFQLTYQGHSYDANTSSRLAKTAPCIVPCTISAVVTEAVNPYGGPVTNVSWKVVCSGKLVSEETIVATGSGTTFTPTLTTPCNYTVWLKGENQAGKQGGADWGVEVQDPLRYVGPARLDWQTVFGVKTVRPYAEAGWRRGQASGAALPTACPARLTRLSATHCFVLRTAPSGSITVFLAGYSDPKDHFSSRDESTQEVTYTKSAPPTYGFTPQVGTRRTGAQCNVTGSLTLEATKKFAYQGHLLVQAKAGRRWKTISSGARYVPGGAEDELTGHPEGVPGAPITEQVTMHLNLRATAVRSLFAKRTAFRLVLRQAVSPGYKPHTIIKRFNLNRCTAF